MVKNIVTTPTPPKKEKKKEQNTERRNFLQGDYKLNACLLRSKKPSGHPHLLRALSISMTTSTERAMVMGLGWEKTEQSIPANISS